jgi:streptogramin lyase
MAYQELQRIAVGNAPLGTLYNSGSIWCHNNFASTVSRVNPSTGAVIATITLNGSTTGIAQDAFGNVWVSSTAAASGSNYGLHRINPATNTVDQQLEINIDYSGVSFADGDLIVSRSGGGGVTSRVDPTTFAFTNISKAAAPRGYSNGSQTAAYDGTLLWLTNFGNDAVYGLDSSNAYVSTITAVTDPFQCVYAFGYLWVCGRGGAGDGFWRINVSTNATTQVILTATTGVTFDANYLYVGNSNVVRRVDPSTLAVTALYTHSVFTPIFDPVMDGNTIWFALRDTDELVQIGELGVGWVRGHAWG